MAPVCVISGQPQSFAVPHGGTDSSSRETGVYIEPMLRLGQIATELARVAYGGAGHIQSMAIVEEQSCLECGTVWWLVFTRSSPAKLRIPDEKTSTAW